MPSPPPPPPVVVIAPRRILVWGINYAPEVTGIAPYNTQLCEFLTVRGHEVRMLTTFAYYPHWQKTEGDRGRLYRTDLLNGIPVHRCWHYVPRRATTLRRIIHEFTFGLTSALRALTLPRADLLVIVSPPLILGWFAWVVTQLRGGQFVFHVQDLQPDAAVGLGMVQPGRLTRSLYALEAFAYRKAARVAGISEGMMRAFARKGVPADKLIYFPNWTSPTARPVAAAAPARARLRYAVPPDALLAFYSGNLGRKQGLEVLIAAAFQLAAAAPSRPVVILIAGDGAARAELAATIIAHNLSNLRLLPLLADGDYHALLAAADVCLITQASGTGQFFFPSKLLTILAAGKPVLAVADSDSELACAVGEGGFGAVSPGGDGVALAARLRALAADPAPLRAWAAHSVWVERFAATPVLNAFAAELEKLAAKPGGQHKSAD